MDDPGACGAERVFVGFDAAPLERAAAELIRRADGPESLGDLLVALPGARAGRAFIRHLGRAAAARGWPGFFPPQVLTQGSLVDALVQLPRPTADRLVRTLAWERALLAVGRSTVTRIVRRPPDRSDRTGWWRLAQTLRTAHAELRAEGRDFSDVGDALRRGG